jgi:hypothetical protein
MNGEKGTLLFLRNFDGYAVFFYCDKFKYTTQHPNPSKSTENMKRIFFKTFSYFSFREISVLVNNIDAVTQKKKAPRRLVP